MQAQYHPRNDGHFGLSLDEYAHFTSPIRRYPDLLVHRAITHCEEGGKPSNYNYSPEDMLQLGEHCSVTERRADDAVRDVMDWLKCEYIQDHIGETYEGVITTVTGFGLFVELADIYVEGLVHITSLSKDYYRFDPVSHSLTGERSGKTYSLGGKITVQVAAVNLDERKIDFQPVESVSTRSSSGSTGKKAAKKKISAKSKKKTPGKGKTNKRSRQNPDDGKPEVKIKKKKKASGAQKKKAARKKRRSLKSGN